MRIAVVCLVFFLLPDAERAAADEVAPNWIQVTDHATWQARDSQGEVLFQDKLWILGGWFDSYSAPPRDVWNSADGKEWRLVEREAPWKHSDLPMTVVFRDKMWLMGGWYNGRLPDHSASNEVWRSSDGVDWRQATAAAGWTPRLGAGAVVFKEKMWILGGTEDYYFGDESSLKNDVWCSSDGEEWTCATGKSGWSPRAYHQAIVFEGKLWVLGGGNYVPSHQAFNDVWCSEDGIHWTRVTAAAPWDPRIWFSSVVYRNRMWVLGGWSKATGNLGDVWYSDDGTHWTELKCERVWKPRHEHSAFVFQDKIWVAGGMSSGLTNEVWSLNVPAEWFEKK